MWFASKTSGKFLSSKDHPVLTGNLDPLRSFVNQVKILNGQYSAGAPDLPRLPVTIRASVIFELWFLLNQSLDMPVLIPNAFINSSAVASFE